MKTQNIIDSNWTLLGTAMLGLCIASTSWGFAFKRTTQTKICNQVANPPTYRVTQNQMGSYQVGSIYDGIFPLRDGNFLVWGNTNNFNKISPSGTAIMTYKSSVRAGTDFWHAEAPGGTLALITFDGLNLYDSSGNQTANVPLPMDPRFNVPTSAWVIVGTDGNFIVGTQDGEIFFVDKNGAMVHPKLNLNAKLWYPGVFLKDGTLAIPGADDIGGMGNARVLFVDPQGQLTATYLAPNSTLSLSLETLPDGNLKVSQAESYEVNSLGQLVADAMKYPLPHGVLENSVLQMDDGTIIVNASDSKLYFFDKNLINTLGTFIGKFDEGWFTSAASWFGHTERDADFKTRANFLRGPVGGFEAVLPIDSSTLIATNKDGYLYVLNTRGVELAEAQVGEASIEKIGTEKFAVTVEGTSQRMPPSTEKSPLDLDFELSQWNISQDAHRNDKKPFIILTMESIQGQSVQTNQECDSLKSIDRY